MISSPHPVDINVGKQLRLFRKQRGLSQNYLGKAVDITSQQVQKYESGINRISASRLYQFAIILDCDVVDFFAKHQSPDDPVIMKTITIREK